MTTTIWHQSTLDLDAYPRYRTFLEAHYERVFAGTSTKIDLHGVPEGTWGDHTPSDLARSPYTYMAYLGQFMIDAATAAEAEGYDAFMLGSYTEPFLRETRSAVTIPVTSILESSVLMACTVATRIGMVTLNDWNVFSQRTALEKHQLNDRIAGYWVADELNEADIDVLFDDPAPFIDAFTRAAREAIAQQADAIVPSEGVVAALVASAGLREIDGVSVVDGIATPLLHTEMLAKAHRRFGLEAGRHWHYTKPPADRNVSGARQ